MEIKYQFFEKDCLLIQKFIGLFSFEDYLSYNRYIAEVHSSILIKKVLIDFRDLKLWENNDIIPDDFDERIDEIVKIRRNINLQEHKTQEVKSVFWVDNPLPTVVVHIFTQHFSGMEYDYCSTTSKVTEILNIPSYKKNLENIIKNLENTFINI